MCHGRVLPHSALIVKFGSRWLKLAIWSCSRILAGYRACHVTYQLNISSIKLRLLLISSNIELTFWTHRKPQICGGNIKLIGRVQGWSRDNCNNVHWFYLCYLSSACPGSHVPLYRVTLGADINYSALLMPPPLMYSMMWNCLWNFEELQLRNCLLLVRIKYR